MSSTEVASARLKSKFTMLVQSKLSKVSAISYFLLGLSKIIENVKWYLQPRNQWPFDRKQRPAN